MNHQGTVVLETERLILRPFKMEDAVAMYENWACDPEVTEHLSWEPHESVEVTQSIIQGWVDDYENPMHYQWAIVVKGEGDEPIGSIGAVGSSKLTQSIAVGYCIGKKWWRKGYTSEALNRLLPFFFEEVGANRVEANHVPGNPNSGKVLTKCGFLHEGTRRQRCWDARLGLLDSVEYAILADDFA